MHTRSCLINSYTSPIPGLLSDPDLRYILGWVVDGGHAQRLQSIAKNLRDLPSNTFFITNKTARNKGHDIHTNKTQQLALKYNTLFGHYRCLEAKS